MAEAKYKTGDFIYVPAGITVYRGSLEQKQEREHTGLVMYSLPSPNTKGHRVAWLQDGLWRQAEESDVQPVEDEQMRKLSDLAKKLAS